MSEEKKSAVSIGASSPMSFSAFGVNNQQPPAGAAASGEGTNNNNAGDGGASGGSGDGGAGGDNNNNPTPVTEAQVLEFLKNNNIEATDFNSLKEKLLKKDPPPPLTPEQQKAQAEELNKKMLTFYLENGGKAEDFVTLAQIAASDNINVLAINEIKLQLKAEGFDEKEVDDVFKNQYFQLNLDELTKPDDMSDEDFNKLKKDTEKKINYGKKAIEGRGNSIKQSAVKFFDNLKNALSEKELQAQREASISSKVDEILSKATRKVNLELGKVNDQEITPVQYEISDTEIDAVKDVLKDSQKRQQFLFTQDNELNLDNIARVLLENNYLKNALKATYVAGGNNQIEAFKKVFPGASAYDVGVGGSSQQNTQKGKPATFGKAQPMSVTRN